jgi:hypothetical protein
MVASGSVAFTGRPDERRVNVVTATAEKVKTSKFVVLSDAVVVTVGKKPNGRPAYTRVLRGGVLNAPEGSEQVAVLLAKGAIRQVRTTEERDALQADLRDPRRSKHRQTVRQAAKAMGAPDDPVQAPQQSVLPLPAPAGGIGVQDLSEDTE